MPEEDTPDVGVAAEPSAPMRPERSAAQRAADHAAIAASIDELLPALIAKLGATGLGELEIREDALRVRIRRPADGVVTHDRRAGDRSGRADRSTRAPGATGALGSTGVGGPTSPTPPGTATIHVSGLTAVGPGRDGRLPEAGREGHEIRPEIRELARTDDSRAVATSPAVGIYHPRAEARAGTRVRAGDRLGTVDMLGVPQEVVAPVDGLVGASLVEGGDAVEYGQDLVVIEFATAASGAGPGAGQGPAAQDG